LAPERVTFKEAADDYLAHAEPDMQPSIRNTASRALGYASHYTTATLVS
jgi:hypothetical protein